jgi:uncharacterized protein (DUF1697 family)
VTRQTTRYVALLRGVNVGGTRKLPMAELRTLCAAEGFADVATYIQSGNLVLTSDESAKAVATRLQTAITARFELIVPVVVRTAGAWRRYAAGSPFPDAEAARPKLLLLCLPIAPLAADAVATLAARAAPRERVAAAAGDDAFWIDFGESIGNSKITPGTIDRAAGSPVTTRNWNTVLAIDAMLEAA